MAGLEQQLREQARMCRSYGSALTGALLEGWPAAERACREHLDRLRELVQRPVQTNEVGRSAVLYGVLLMLPGPLRLLEVGASAGLNLRCDGYAYAVGDAVLGDPASPVRIEQPWTGAHPLASESPPRAGVHLIGRKGCEPCTRSIPRRRRVG